MSFTHVATTYLGPGRRCEATVSRKIYECDDCEGLVERKKLDEHRCPMKNSLQRLAQSISKIDAMTVNATVKENEERSRFTADLMTRESLIRGLNERMENSYYFGRIYPT